jgi:succinate--hydroxymethylglutarate CoA-transferase
MLATADVIKVCRTPIDLADKQIESPLKGDDTRSWLPPFAPLSTDSTVPRPDLPPESAYFLQANRNKRS